MARLYPALQRHWRTRRGLSQLDLAVAANVSSRHVSFLETGRARPSREMVLRIASTMDVPLRDQNELLRAAGFDAEFAEPAELDPSIARAIERMFAVHDPYPITLLDRRYDVVRVNDAGRRILGHFLVDPGALGASPNAFDLLFDPRLVRPHVVEWPRIAHGMVARLHREALANPTRTELGELLRRLFTYPDVPEAWRQPDFTTPSEAILTLRLARGDLTVSFLTTVTSFSAPQNVTLEELRIESYFPLDDATAETCARLARGE